MFAIFLVCFNFQSASMLLKVGENVWVSNSLDLHYMPSYSASHPDSSSNMGRMGSKSRSLGQFLEKYCLHSRGHIFSPIFLLRAFVLMISWSSLIMGWGGVKKKVTSKKNLVYTPRATFFAQSSSNLLRILILMISRSSSIMGWLGLKIWSLGQILEKYCLHSRGHTFDPIFTKLCQKVCIDDI